MQTDDVVALAGRLLLSSLFLAFAFGKITNFEGTTAYMDAHGLPMAPLLCAAAVLLEAVCGMALMLGFHARWAAGLLAAYVLMATLLFHAGPDQRIHMIKNLAIIGGLLQVVAFGSGAASLEGGRKPT